MNIAYRRAVLALFLTGLAGCYTPPAPLPIVIGHVADQTRADKAGEQARLGIRLALHELNKDEALTTALGGRPVEVRHTDTRGSLDADESQAVRLVSINRAVALLGGLSAPETTALDQTPVPLLTFHGYRPAGASSQVFYLGMTPARQGEVLAQVVAEDAHIRRLVMFVDERRPESAIVAETFAKSLADAGNPGGAKAPAILTLRFGKDARWPELLERTRAHDPHAVLFAGAVLDFTAWHRAYRQEVFLTEPMLVYAGEDVPAASFDLDARTPTKIVRATAFLADAAAEKTKAFREAYQKAFQSEADVHAALAYDGFRILAEALKRAQPQLTLDRIREELQNTKDFAGLTGPLTVTPDRLVQRPLFVVRWHRGTLTHLKTFP